MSFEVQNTRIINLSAKMNNRQNNETLEVDPNSKGLELVSLSNADLFNTNTLASRLGTTDICGGIVDESVSISCALNLLTPPTGVVIHSGSTSQIRLDIEPRVQNGKGMIIIPTGNFNLYSGNVFLQGYFPATLSPNGTVSADDYSLQMKLYQLNQVPLPSSGTSWFSGTTNIFSHSILWPLTNYSVPASSGVADIPHIAGGLLSPVAISNSGGNFNVGLFSGAAFNWFSDITPVAYKFEAPYMLTTGNVYYMVMEVYGKKQQAAGVQAADFFANDLQIQTLFTDFMPNTALAVTQVSSGFDIVQPFSYGINSKAQLQTCLQQYNGASYLLVDIPTATNDMSSPLVSGLTFNGSISTENVVTQTVPFVSSYFNGATQTPNFDTSTVEFGQSIFIPSGTWNVFGSYFYATPNARPLWNNYTRNKAVISGNGYNLGYVGRFSTIDNSSGTLAGGDFKVNRRTVVAEFSGNYVFDNILNNASGNNLATSANYDLHKIYALYDNPITITVPGTGSEYLLSFKYYDFQTGGDYTDFTYRNITTGPFSPTTQFQSFVQTGFDKAGTYNNSGTFMMNYNNDDQTFITPSGDTYFTTPTQDNLSCGLIVVQSGNGITSVYDYRVGDSRSQRIIYTIQDKVKEFELHAPAASNHIVIHSGAAIGNELKWSHSTFQNDLFSHQYSQTSGLYWDQIYSGTANDFMQLHGLRPNFAMTEVPSATGIAGTGTGASYLASGTSISLILGTQLNSGGIRASITGNIATTGVSSYVKLDGTDIFNPVGLALGTGTSQYKFDVAPGQPTYVFATENGGSTFYLADLYTGTSVQTLSQFINPVPSTGTFPLYIKNVSGPSSTGNIVLTQQVPQVILNPQEYLTNQVDVPKFKKTIVYKNMLLGIGDTVNPSRLWFSEIQAPNIYGVDTNFFGFYDIDNDNGQELTGIEIFKDYLILFKQNSTYRANFTANPGDPLDFFKLSSTIGNLGIFDTVSTDYGVFGLSQFGPILASYAGADTIGDEILPYYQQLDHSSLIFSVAIHDRERQQIYWSISNENLSPDRNIGLTYSYAEKAWTIRENGMWLSGAANGVGDADNFTLLYCGDVLGQIFALDNGVADQDVLFNDGNGNVLTQNVSLVAETPWLNFGNSQDLKQLKNLRINCDNSNQRLKIDVYFDQNQTTPKYTRYLNMNVPVINRVISLAQNCRTCKFVITSVGSPSRVKLNSIQIGFIELGPRINI